MDEAGLGRLDREAAGRPGDCSLSLARAAAWERQGDRGRALAVLYPWQHVPEVLERIRSLVLTGAVAACPRRHLLAAPDLGPATGRAVTALAFDPGEALLAAGFAGGELWLQGLEPEPGARPPRRLTAVPGGVSCLAFSPDGLHLFFGGGERVLRRWDLDEDRGEKASQRLPARLLSLACLGDRQLVAWEDGSRVISSKDGGGAVGPARLGVTAPMLLRPGGAQACRAVLGRLVRRLRATAPGPAQTDLALPALDPVLDMVGLLGSGRLLLHDPLTGAELEVQHPRLARPRGPHLDQGHALALAPGGRALALGSTGKRFHRDPSPGPFPRGGALVLAEEPVRVLTFAEDEIVTAVAFSAVGARFAYGTSRGRVGLLDLQPGRPAREAPTSPRLGRALPATSEGDPVERPGVPASSASEFRLLRRLRDEGPRERLAVTAAARLHLGAAALHLCFLGGLDRLGHERCPAVDLDSGRFGTAGELGAAGLCALPPPRVAGRAAAERALDLRVLEWRPDPTGERVVVRAVRRPRELWILDPSDPGEASHHRLNHRPAGLAWSPRGTRLTALLRDGSVWVYG